MTRGSMKRNAVMTTLALVLAACGTSDPMAPSGADARLAPPVFARPDYVTAAVEPPAVPTWELSGLQWGHAPGGPPGNEVVALRSTLAIALRDKKLPASTIRLRFPPGKTVTSLGAMSYRFLMEAGDCGGGSPRLQVGLDTDGDGDFDANAFGYAGPSGAGFTGCGTGAWVNEVATDGDPAWDLSSLVDAGPYVVGWDEAVVRITDAHPDHQVLWLLWVQDSFWLFDPLVTWVDDLDLDGAFLGSPGDLK